MSKSVTIEVIPHKDQRYPTVGDWQWDENGNLKISVSDMDNWKYEMLVALHEMVEVLLCKDRGIRQVDVDRFDVQFEREREEGMQSADAEPGDSPDAPYRKEHFFATNLERLLAAELKVDWNDYDRTVMEL